MKRVAKSLALFTALGLLSFLPFGHADDSGNPNDILIIVNRSVKIDATAKELKDIFLKRRKSWQMGQKVVPIHARSNLEIRDVFRKMVLELDRNEENAYWQELKIRAAEDQPVTFSNRLKAVFKLRGSVSYIYRHQYREGVVRVLMVIPSE